MESTSSGFFTTVMRPRSVSTRAIASAISSVAPYLLDATTSTLMVNVSPDRIDTTQPMVQGRRADHSSGPTNAVGVHVLGFRPTGTAGDRHGRAAAPGAQRSVTLGSAPTGI